MDEINGGVGDTGNSRGPHLRFNYRKGGSPFDPTPLELFNPTGAPCPTCGRPQPASE